jgi:hypothetical protein
MIHWNLDEDKFTTHIYKKNDPNPKDINTLLAIFLKKFHF